MMNKPETNRTFRQFYDTRNIWAIQPYISTTSADWGEVNCSSILSARLQSDEHNCRKRSKFILKKLVFFLLRKRSNNIGIAHRVTPQMTQDIYLLQIRNTDDITFILYRINNNIELYFLINFDFSPWTHIYKQTNKRSNERKKKPIWTFDLK